MTGRAPFAAELSRAESARFGVATARLEVTEVGTDTLGETVAAVRDALAETDAAIVILRFPAAALALLARLDVHLEWVYFPGGSLLYWEAPLAPALEADASSAEVVPADREHHVRGISRVIRDSFRGYINHYAADPLIPDGAAEAGYLEWAHVIIADPASRLFIVRDRGEVAGVAVVTDADGTWDIRLAGIASAVQGRGLYRRLIARVSAAAAAEGARLVISTQAHNTAVQRAWASFGWRPYAATDTVHLVRRRALA